MPLKGGKRNLCLQVYSSQVKTKTITVNGKCSPKPRTDVGQSSIFCALLVCPVSVVKNWLLKNTGLV